MNCPWCWFWVPQESKVITVCGDRCVVGLGPWKRKSVEDIDRFLLQFVRIESEDDVANFVAELGLLGLAQWDTWYASAASVPRNVAKLDKRLRCAIQVRDTERAVFQLPEAVADWLAWRDHVRARFDGADDVSFVGTDGSLDPYWESDLYRLMASHLGSPAVRSMDRRYPQALIEPAGDWTSPELQVYISHGSPHWVVDSLLHVLVAGSRMKSDISPKLCANPRCGQWFSSNQPDALYCDVKCKRSVNNRTHYREQVAKKRAEKNRTRM